MQGAWGALALSGGTSASAWNGSPAELGLGTNGLTHLLTQVSFLRWRQQLPPRPGVVCVLWEPTEAPGPRQASAGEHPRYGQPLSKQVSGLVPCGVSAATDSPWTRLFQNCTRTSFRPPGPQRRASVPHSRGRVASDWHGQPVLRSAHRSQMREPGSRGHTPRTSLAVQGAAQAGRASPPSERKSSVCEVRVWPPARELC